MANKNDIDFLDLGDDVPEIYDPEGKSKDRSRGVTGHVKDVASQTLDNMTSFEKHAESAMGAIDKTFNSSTMDREYNDIKDIIYNTKDTLENSYDGIRKEVSSLAKNLKALTPDILGLKSLVGMFVSEEDGGYRSESEAARKEREIQEGVTSTLGSIEEFQNKVQEAIQTANQNSNQSTNEILKEIAATSNFSKFYQTEYTSKYYRKSLELQLRQTMLLKDILAVSQAMSVDNKNFLGGILKNTSLPDILKQRTMEMMGNDIKVRLRSSFLDSFVFNKNLLRDFGLNLNNRIKEYGDGIKNTLAHGVDLTGMLAETKAQLESMGMDPLDFVKGNIAQGAVDKTHEFFIPRLIRHIAGTKYGGKAIEHIRRLYDSPASYFQTQHGNALKDEVEKGSNFFTSLRKFIFGELAQLTSTRNKTASVKFSQEDLNATASFDFRTRKTINSVIPGLLGMIYAETKATRLNLKHENVNALIPKFDYINERFTTARTIKEMLKRQLGMSVRKHTNISGLVNLFKDENFSKNLAEDGIKLTDDEIELFARAAARTSIDVSHGGLELFKSPEFLKALPDSLKSKYKPFLKSLTKEYDKERLGTGKDRFASDLRYAVDSTRSSVPNAYKYISDRIAAGDIKELIEMKILKRDSNDPSILTFNEKMAKKYMFNMFGLGKEHINIISKDDVLKPADLALLKTLGGQALELGGKGVNKILSLLPDKVEKNIHNIADAMSKDINSLAGAGEEKLFESITKLDEYIESREYEKLPDKIKEEILTAKEAGHAKLDAIMESGKSKLKKVNKRSVRGFFKTMKGFFTKEKAVTMSKNVKDSIVNKYKDYKEAYDADGMKGIKSEFKDNLNSLNEKTLAKYYNKLPEDLRKSIESAKGDKKKLLNKDYYVSVLSAAADSLPTKYQEMLFDNKVSKGIKSTYTAIKESNTAKAFSQASTDAKDYLKEKYDNSTTVKAVKEKLENLGANKKELQDKLDLLEMIHDAVKSRSPEMLDEVEELIGAYNYGNDKLLMDNLEAGRKNIEQGKTFAGKAFDYLKKVTDPVEYSVKAGKLIGSVWDYVPAGFAFKLAGMGIGGYFRALRKADRWVRDKIFMGGLKTLFKPLGFGLKTGYKTLETAATGLGGAGMWGLGKILGSGIFGGDLAYGGHMMSELGSRGMTRAGNNIKAGAKKVGGFLGGVGGFAKNALGFGVGLPLLGLWKAARIGTGTIGHVLGLDKINPFPWLGRKIYNRIWGKKDDAMKLDSKTSFLLKKGKSMFGGIFSMSEEERAAEEKKEEIKEEVMKAASSGELDSGQIEALTNALGKKKASNKEQEEAIKAIAESDLGDKKKISLIKRLYYVFGTLGGGILSKVKGGISSILSAPGRLKNWLSGKYNGIKKGIGKIKDGIGGFLKLFRRNKYKGMKEKAKRFFDSLTNKGKANLKKLAKSKGYKGRHLEYIEEHYRQCVDDFSDEVKDKSKLVNGRYEDDSDKKGGIFGGIKSMIGKMVGFLGLFAIKGIGFLGTIASTIMAIRNEFFTAKGWMGKMTILGKTLRKVVTKPIEAALKFLGKVILRKAATDTAADMLGGGIRGPKGKKGFLRRMLSGGLRLGSTLLSGGYDIITGIGGGIKNLAVSGYNKVKQYAGKLGQIIANAGTYFIMIKNKLGDIWKSVLTTIVEFFKSPKQFLINALSKTPNVAGKKLCRKAIEKVVVAVCKKALTWLAGITVGAAVTSWAGGVGGLAVAAFWLCSAALGFFPAWFAGSTLVGCIIAAFIGFDPLREIFGIGDEEMTRTEDMEEMDKKASKVSASQGSNEKMTITGSKEEYNFNNDQRNSSQQGTINNTYNTYNTTQDTGMTDVLKTNHSESLNQKRQMLDILTMQAEESKKTRELLENIYKARESSGFSVENSVAPNINVVGRF